MGVAQNHDSVRRWRQPTAEMGEHPAGVQREPGSQCLAMDSENFAVVLGICDEQDEAIQMGVALLQRKPSLERLQIGQVGFGLDSDDPIQSCLRIEGLADHQVSAMAPRSPTESRWATGRESPPGAGCALSPERGLRSDRSEWTVAIRPPQPRGKVGRSRRYG